MPCNPGRQSEPVWWAIIGPVGAIISNTASFVRLLIPLGVVVMALTLMAQDRILQRRHP